MLAFFFETDVKWYPYFEVNDALEINMKFL